MHKSQTLLLIKKIKTLGRQLCGERNSGTRLNFQPRTWQAIEKIPALNKRKEEENRKSLGSKHSSGKFGLDHYCRTSC